MGPDARTELRAARLRVRGVVQGVGFRPFVFRAARERGLVGWVRNDRRGASVHIEGSETAINEFLAALEREAPPAARIERVDVAFVSPLDLTAFDIRDSENDGAATARITPDLGVCAQCLSELDEPRNRRHGYAYTNCTDCGPRYSIVTALPYDRPHTTMAPWAMCGACAAEYADPLDRRFHAQPIACPRCGPDYTYDETTVTYDETTVEGKTADGGATRLQGSPAASIRGAEAVRSAARALALGKIVAVKGIGGYHLACDARQPATVWALRERKYRKEQAFAIMARDLGVARRVVHLDPAGEALLSGVGRPIVLVPARVELEGVAPGNADLGVMLPYTPAHHLLFAVGAPELLVMTSGNRSSEPIAFRDDDARARLAGIADAWLVGERPIARRVDDSVVRAQVPYGPTVIRRGRGLSPAVVAQLPSDASLLAVGADLKNTVTLVVGGEAMMSQHIGDLAHLASRESCDQTIADLLAMYELDVRDLTIVHDRHPQYASTALAQALPGVRHCAVQHHRAHIASVLAERGAWETRVVGIALDGTGYGDDGGIWGGEIFVGSVASGLQRVGHLREAALPGGDAAQQHPVQAAAGFLAQVDDSTDLSGPPFDFPERYGQARELIVRDVRVFRTTSMGRLFDCLAALLGFVRPVTFEAQAAMWLEHLARNGRTTDRYAMPYHDGELDFRPLVAAVLAERRQRRPIEEIARAVHRTIAHAIAGAACAERDRSRAEAIVLSGGVCQNAVLTSDIAEQLTARGSVMWVNHTVPANDGGISLGQAALAAWA